MLSIVQRNNLIFYIHALDNWCDNALDLSNGTEGKLTVESKWPIGTYCQWLIPAIDDKHYINLEFESLDVSIAELNYQLTEAQINSTSSDSFSSHS